MLSTLVNIRSTQLGNTTVIQKLGYVSRITIKKGFSDDLAVMRQRVTFAQQAITWDRRRVSLLLFWDEVWVKGGAYTVE
jgi:hypothetical protein